MVPVAPVTTGISFVITSHIGSYYVVRSLYFMKDLEMVPVAPVTTGISFVITSHIGCYYVVRSLYLYFTII